MEFDIGDRVLTRCLHGEIRENRVWSIGSKVIYVCSDKQYQALQAGELSPPPIGFPYADVMTIDAAKAQGEKT